MRPEAKYMFEKINFEKKEFKVGKWEKIGEK